MKIVTRRYAEADRDRLLACGVHPLLARLFAARQISSKDQLEQDFLHLIPPAELTNADRAARLLADAIAQRLNDGWMTGKPKVIAPAEIGELPSVAQYESAPGLLERQREQSVATAMDSGFQRRLTRRL